MQEQNSAAIASKVRPNNGLGVLVRSEQFTNLLPGVHTLGGQGNSLAVETARGVVVVDAGPGGGVTMAMIERLRTLSDQPVLAIVFSHGHAGYNAGLQQWFDHAATRGEPRPRAIAQDRVRPRYQRYLETAGMQAWLNGRQFRRTMRALNEDAFIMPDQTFSVRMSLDCGDRIIELISAPSETDDTLAVWLPAERFLYGSAAMIRSIPNVGTPLRTIRDPMRWVGTLERLYALRPAMVLPEFGDPITDPKEIEDAFQVPIQSLRYLRDEVVRRMNAGMNEREILHDMNYPEALFGHRFMRPIYGTADYIVREIWRMENGWWDRNPTHLHPARPAEAAAARLGALGDPAAVLARARALHAEGKTQLAMDVVDLVALAESDDPVVRDAKELKAVLCEARACDMSSVVSRQILRSCAEDLRGQPIGTTREQDPPANFSWN